MRAKLVVLAVAAVVAPIPAVLAEVSGGGSSSITSSEPGCSLEPARMDTDGCPVLASDTAASTDAASVWGSVDCAQPSRQQRVARRGDPHRLGTGARQGNGAYRRITVVDGDDFYGERCELGHNSSLSDEPTFARFEEGERAVTFASLRFPGRFPLRRSMWQTVLQMKQAQPSANGGGGPILEVNARHGQLVLFNDWHRLWATPVRHGIWIRIALDVRYSQDRARGTVRMYVDGNGDGDARDRGEKSPLFRVSTLKRETEGGSPDDGIAPGQSIPSHLRAGIYHDPSYPCPLRRPCVVHLDNVQVVELQPADPSAGG
jgi:hypothetical protein